MRYLLLALISLAVFAANAQTDTFEWEKHVFNVNATVRILEDTKTVVIVPDDNPNTRYISAQMPEAYKIEGLKVTFTGWIGKIPPHFRMMGTPLKLEKIWITAAEKKKHKLAKRCYKF